MDLTALVAAAHGGDDRRVHQCLTTLQSRSFDQQCSIVRQRDESGRLPLHYAANFGLVALTTYCLTHHSPLNLLDGQQQSPLHLALKNRHPAVVAKLLASDGVDVDVRDSFGRLPLHWAAQANYVDYFDQLATNTTINAATNSGETPLHWAIVEGNGAMVKLLLERGANPLIEDARGQSPLSLSQSSANKSIASAVSAAAERAQASQSAVSESVPTSIGVDLSARPSIAKPAAKKLKITLKPK